MRVNIMVNEYTTAEYIMDKFCEINKIEKIYELNINLDRYILSEKLCLIVGLYKHKKHCGYNIEVKISGENSYAERIDFYKQMGIDKEENFIRQNASGRFIEIKNFTGEDNEILVNSIVRIFRDSMEMDNSLLGCLNYCLFEIIDNVALHSKSPIGGYVAVQNFPQQGELRVIIMDCGIGIYRSLSQNSIYKEVDEEKALELSINEHITSTGDSGRGNGLYHTSKFIEANNGNLQILSGNKRLSVKKDEINIDNIPYFNGTIVTLLVKTSNIIIPEDVFGENVPTTVEEVDYCIEGLW